MSSNSSSSGSAGKPLTPGFNNANHSSTASAAQQGAEEEYFIKELTQEQVHQYVKIPQNFLEKALIFGKELGASLFMSIREKRPKEMIESRSNRRHSMDFDPKTTYTSGKTVTIENVSHGRITRNPDALSLDDNLLGRFADGISELQGNEKQLEKKLLDTASPNIQKVCKSGNLICYSEEIYKREKDKDTGEIKTSEKTKIVKHFIQEAESFDSILFKIQMGVYSDWGIVNNELFFKSTEKSQPKLFKFDLKNIFPTPSQNIDWSKIENGNVDSLIEFVEENKISEFHVPLWKQSSLVKDEFEPYMLHTGKNGRPIAGDTDPGHIGIIPGLPLSAHTTFFSKTATVEHFLSVMEQCIQDLNAMQPKNEKIIELFKKTLELYGSNKELFKEVGTSSLYSLVMQTAFDHHMWLHGAEDTHPCGKPEDFSGMLSVWNGKFYLTDGEKAYLDLLFNLKPPILEGQEIGVHPHWLLGGKNGPDLSQSWMDLIEIQILSRYNNTNGNINEALAVVDNLIQRIGILDNKDRDENGKLQKDEEKEGGEKKGSYFRADGKSEVAADAINKLTGFRAQLELYLKQSSTDVVGKKISDLYGKHKMTGEISLLKDTNEKHLRKRAKN